MAKKKKSGMMDFSPIKQLGGGMLGMTMAGGIGAAGATAIGGMGPGAAGMAGGIGGAASMMAPLGATVGGMATMGMASQMMNVLPKSKKGKKSMF